jgi:P2-related tail formation protein
VGRFSATTCGKIFSILIVQDTINLAGQMQRQWENLPGWLAWSHLIEQWLMEWLQKRQRR